MRLVVVSVERQVEALARAGERAETRRRLFERLCAAFLQHTRFAEAATTRAALATVLENADERIIDAYDDAIGAMNAAAVDAAALGVLEEQGREVRALRTAMNALNVRLERAGLVDARLRGVMLARSLSTAPRGEVARVVGAEHLLARFVTRWDASDGAWWKALARELARDGGDALVEVRAVAKAIDASRAADPFEVLVADLARVLDAPPVELAIASVFGDLTLTTAVPDIARERVEIRDALDAAAQARAAALAVEAALERRVAIDRIAIALPRGTSDASKAALVQHFEEAGIALHIGGTKPAVGALADIALSLLDVGAAGLPRHEVAAIARAKCLDPAKMAGIVDGRSARGALRDFADALERTPTADAEDGIERLVATAMRQDSAHRARRGAIARRLGEALIAPGVTRASRARAARALFAKVGLAARAGSAVRAALALDEPATGLARAEVDAYARDARVVEALAAALEDVEGAGVALGEDPCSAETFAHELRRALRVRGASGAARAGAVRAVALDELAGEWLELLVVVDANTGVVGARAVHSSALTATLAESLEDRAAIASPLVELAAATEHANRIVVCHRLNDEDGSVLAPSPLVSWLVRGGVASTRVHSAPLLGPPSTPHERELALLALAPDRAPQLAPHAARVASREYLREAFHAGDVPASQLALPLDSAVRSILESETGGGARPLSITAVERAARCAFQGFAAQVLGALDDDSRTEDTPDRREEGILVHEALAAAFTAAAPFWRARPRNRVAITTSAANAAAAVLARGGSALVRAALDRIRLEVARIVDLAVDDVDWDFASAESGFGNTGDAWPALVIENATGRVTLRGRIDRIDIAHDHSAIRVVDYKRRVTLSPVVDLGTAVIQVPIYAIVARRALAAPAALGRYLSTLAPEKDQPASFDARLGELVAEPNPEALRFAYERIHEIRVGNIAPKPIAPKWCAQCGLDGACRRPRFAVTMLPRDDSE